MKILMAYDATIEGRDKLLAAPELEWVPHQETHLLAVLPMPSGLFVAEGYVPGEVLDEEKARAQLVLDAGVGVLKQRGFAATAHVTWGEPVDEICALAKEISANLIVVCHPRRKSFAARWWKGWLGSALMEKAPCSVVISVSPE
jgi:nucleotide-binding universal stress UspA family protein